MRPISDSRVIRPINSPDSSRFQAMTANAANNNIFVGGYHDPVVSFRDPYSDHSGASTFLKVRSGPSVGARDREIDEYIEHRKAGRSPSHHKSSSPVNIRSASRPSSPSLAPIGAGESRQRSGSSGHSDEGKVGKSLPSIQANRSELRSSGSPRKLFS